MQGTCIGDLRACQMPCACTRPVQAQPPLHSTRPLPAPGRQGSGQGCGDPGLGQRQLLGIRQPAAQVHDRVEKAAGQQSGWQANKGSLTPSASRCMPTKSNAGSSIGCSMRIPFRAHLALAPLAVGAHLGPVPLGVQPHFKGVVGAGAGVPQWACSRLAHGGA